MAINDNAVLVGLESTYGTPATLTRAFEAKSDDIKVVRETIESVGMRAGVTAKRSDRVVTINRGAEGSLAFDVQNKGFGLLLQGMLGSISGPTQQAATAAYLSTATATAAAPGDSFTVQTLRSDINETQTPFTHHGGVITGWELSHSVDGNLEVSFDFDFEDHDTSTGAGTPAYPASTAPFDWTMAAFTIDGNSTCVYDFNLSADLAMKTDRYCMRGNELKKEPARIGTPTFDGSIEMEYDTNTIFDLFVAGDPVAIVGTWTGANIEGAYDYELTVTLPACLLLGDSPVVSFDDTPSLTVPFEALDDGSAACTITYQSTDVAL